MFTPFSAWTNLRGLTRSSFCDWPGRVCAVLFLGGCNLACPTCHNAGLAWRPERHPALDRGQVLAWLKGRARWLDGLTVTGGEPTESSGLAPFLADIRRATGLPVKLDTNGMRPGVVEELLYAGLADVFAVDVKAPYAKYPLVSGGLATAETARHNLEWIFDLARMHPGRFYFRTTMAPALDDSDLAAIRELVPAGEVHVLQQFVPPGRGHAQTDSETGRMSGDLVPGPHRERHPQGAQGLGHQGSPALQAGCA
ncbi:MAG: anaerobic ribonucleoside-triphosphate reductase activating protein [Thermodesulfobacteriota bacterium]